MDHSSKYFVKHAQKNLTSQIKKKRLIHTYFNVGLSHCVWLDLFAVCVNINVHIPLRAGSCRGVQVGVVVIVFFGLCTLKRMEISSRHSHQCVCVCVCVSRNQK